MNLEKKNEKILWIYRMSPMSHSDQSEGDIFFSKSIYFIMKNNANIKYIHYIYRKWQVYRGR